MSPFKRQSDNRVLSKIKSQVFVVYEEGSLASKRDKLRGSVLNQAPIMCTTAPHCA